MPTIILQPQDPHWIDRSPDNTTDQCIHGEISFSVGDTSFITPNNHEWNLTAVGLFLLRTLANNNTPTDSVCNGNFLIPHCGFSPTVDDTEKYPLAIQGCAYGVNILVEHLNEGVLLTIHNAKSSLVSESEWRDAVLGFIGELEDWYSHQPPRVEPEDDYEAEGWREFWGEWQRLKNWPAK